MSYYSATVRRLNKQVSIVRKLMKKKNVELKVAKALATDTFENRDSLSDSEIQEYNELHELFREKAFHLRYLMTLVANAWGELVQPRPGLTLVIKYPHNKQVTKTILKIGEGSFYFTDGSELEEKGLEWFTYKSWVENNKRYETFFKEVSEYLSRPIIL